MSIILKASAPFPPRMNQTSNTSLPYAHIPRKRSTIVTYQPVYFLWGESRYYHNGEEHAVRLKSETKSASPLRLHRDPQPALWPGAQHYVCGPPWQGTAHPPGRTCPMQPDELFGQTRHGSLWKG